MTANPTESLSGVIFKTATGVVVTPEQVLQFRETVDIKKNGMLPLKRFYATEDAADFLQALNKSGEEARALVGKALLYRKAAESWEKGADKAVAAIDLLRDQPKAMQADILSRPYMVGNWIEQNRDVASKLVDIIAKLDEPQQLRVFSTNNTVTNLIRFGGQREGVKAIYDSWSEGSRETLKSHDSFEVSYGIELIEGKPRGVASSYLQRNLSTGEVPATVIARIPV